MEPENVISILKAMIEDCGDLVTQSDLKEILNEALTKIMKNFRTP